MMSVITGINVAAVTAAYVGLSHPLIKISCSSIVLAAYTPSDIMTKRQSAGFFLPLNSKVHSE